MQEDPDMEEEITPAVVACGSEYTASITRRGQLLTWGLGSRGELGHELPHAGEVRATGAPCLLLLLIGLACLPLQEAWGTLTPRCHRPAANPNPPGGVNLVLVQVNFPMRTILFANPDLRIVSVACGHSHTLAIAETGSVWSCGRNGEGQ